MTQTLEELKAENAAAENVEDNQDALLENVEDEETDAEVEAETHDGSEDESSETEDEDHGQNDVQNEEVEGWLLDESETDSGKDVPLSAHIGLRTELKGKLKEAKDENAELRNELAQIREQMQQTLVNPVSQAESPKPRMENFDTEEEFFDALTDWKLQSQMRQMGQNQQMEAQKRQQAEQMRQLSESVDSHYQRAEGLIEEHGIKRDLYQQSDTNVRQAVEEVVPGKGDVGVDFLISNLGEGSEKVMYAVGRNQRLLDELKATLRADPSGFRAVAYLGKKMGEFTQPVKRKSNAPKPGAKIKGDKTPSESPSKKKYAQAFKKGDMQAAFNIKMAAKKAGTDTSSW